MTDADLNRAPHELPAGRELDAKVAETLGYPVVWGPTPYVGFGIEQKQREPWLKGYVNGCNYDWGHVPHYSAGRQADDQARAGLLECVKWLAKSGIGISIESDGVHIGPILTNIHGSDVWVVSVPGFDDAAFALAICRAVVRL